MDAGIVTPPLDRPRQSDRDRRDAADDPRTQYPVSRKAQAHRMAGEDGGLELGRRHAFQERVVVTAPAYQDPVARLDGLEDIEKLALIPSPQMDGGTDIAG